jgi:hypothetical protein
MPLELSTDEIDIIVCINYLENLLTTISNLKILSNSKQYSIYHVQHAINILKEESIYYKVKDDQSIKESK